MDVTGNVTYILTMRLILFGLLLGLSTAQAWDLNDVSILLPLSHNLQSDSVLRPTTQGSAGELIPTRYLQLIPDLAPQAEDAEVNATLAVVGIRLDPCFPGVSPSGEPCHFQVRLIWQPMIELAQETSTRDAGVHSFYELSQDEFTDLLQKISALNTQAGVFNQGLPLQVNPTIAAQSGSGDLGGDYWQKLRAIVLSYTGDERLSRITFMSMQTADQMWDFGEYDISGGKIQRALIPRVQTRLQSFINTSSDHDSFDGAAKPAPEDNPDSLDSLLKKSSSITSSDGPTLRASSDSLYKIENPRLNSPETIDCVSCHVAQSARLWEQSHFPNLKLDQSAFQYQSTFNLQNGSASQRSTHLLRAFGYDGAEPAINQRVINESANVAEALNALQAR